MTTTTKIFIILVCLFAFIFTPMAIQFAARTYDWQRLATDYKSQAETEHAQAQSLRSMRESELADMAAKQRAYAEELAKAVRLRDELNQQIADLTSQRDQLHLSSDSLRSTNELQSASLNVISAQYEQTTKNNKDLTERELKLQTINAGLTAALKDLNAQIIVLQQQLRQREQQLVACRDENETIRHGAGLSRGGEPPVFGPQPTARPTETPAARRIDGHVTKVQGHLATVDVGTSSGIREGIKLVVTRNQNGKVDYVCDLMVTSEVSPNEAVGEVVAGTEQANRIRPGDTVQDETTFSSR